MKDVLLLIIGALLGSVAGLFGTVYYEDRWKAWVARRKRLRLTNSIMRMQLRANGPIHIAGIVTQVHLLEGDGHLILEPWHLKIRIRPEAVTPPPSVTTCRARVVKELHARQHNTSGVATTWASNSLVALCDYRITRFGENEDCNLQVDTAPVDYATFVATVLSLDREFERTDGNGKVVRTTLRRDFLSKDVSANDVVSRPVPFLANGLGVALAAFTDDDKLLLARRRPAAKARGGERDVSVVEGAHAQLDRNNDNTLSIHTTAVRGCREELGVDVASEDVQLLGFAVDMDYYQWNFIGLVNLRKSAQEVLEAQRLHAKDRWEAKLEPIEINPKAVFDRIRSDGIWDLGLVTVYLALCFKCGPDAVQKAAEHVFGSKPSKVPWRRSGL